MGVTLCMYVIIVVFWSSVPRSIGLTEDQRLSLVRLRLLLSETLFVWRSQHRGIVTYLSMHCIVIASVIFFTDLFSLYVSCVVMSYE